MTSPIFSRLHLFRRAGAPPDDPDPPAGSHSPGSPPDGPARSRVKRALFGPVDHEENIRFVHKELAKGRREASERWNYDFENDRPKEGRYEWLQSSVATISRGEEGGQGRVGSSEGSEGQRTASNVDCDKKDISATPAEACTVAAGSAIRASSSESVSGPSDEKCSGTASESSASGARSAAATVKASATIQRQTSIKDHFTHRKKRSRSKVKVQERKKSDEVDENQVSILPAELTTTVPASASGKISPELRTSTDTFSPESSETLGTDVSK